MGAIPQELPTCLSQDLSSRPEFTVLLTSTGNPPIPVSTSPGLELQVYGTCQLGIQDQIQVLCLQGKHFAN